VQETPIRWGGEAQAKKRWSDQQAWGVGRKGGNKKQNIPGLKKKENCMNGGREKKKRKKKKMRVEN